jgi:hypothetical protein
MPPEWRCRGHGVKKALGRCRTTLDVDVLNGLAGHPLAQPLQQPSAAGSASTEHDRYA